MQRWEDEHYVRIYTRDTLTWKRWRWETRTTFLHLMRKVDRAGLLDIGDDEPAEALSLFLDLPIEVTRVAVPQLVERSTVEIRNGLLIIPNYHPAQHAKSSDKQRKQEERARAAANARKEQVVTGETVSAQTNDVTTCHTASEPVTDGHNPSLSTVQYSAVQCSNTYAPAAPDAKANQAEFDLPKAETPEEAAERQRKEREAEITREAKALKAKYQARWMERYQPADQKPPDLDKADAAQLRNLIKAHGAKAVEGWLERFMADNDSYLERDGVKHALKHLTSRVNSYRVGATSQRGDPTRGYAAASPIRPTETKSLIDKL
jgi:hypothetical protein